MCNCGKKRALQQQDGGGGRTVGEPAPVAPVAPVAHVPPATRLRAVPVQRGRPVRQVVAAVAAAAPAPAPLPVAVAAEAQQPRMLHRPINRTVARQVPTQRRVYASTATPARRVVAGHRALPIINPAIWGPPLWRLLHALAELRGTDTDWFPLLESLREGLPCPECSFHYNAWYVSRPLTSNAGVADWLIALHNDVNRRNRKAIWTRADVVTAVGTMTVADCMGLLSQLSGKVGGRAHEILTAMVARLQG